MTEYEIERRLDALDALYRGRKMAEQLQVLLAEPGVLAVVVEGSYLTWASDEPKRVPSHGEVIYFTGFVDPSPVRERRIKVKIWPKTGLQDFQIYGEDLLRPLAP